MVYTRRHSSSIDCKGLKKDEHTDQVSVNDGFVLSLHEGKKKVGCFAASVQGNNRNIRTPNVKIKPSDDDETNYLDRFKKLLYGQTLVGDLHKQLVLRSLLPRQVAITEVTY